MTQALNDSLENLARQHLDQWFWIHRRWKHSSKKLNKIRTPAGRGPK
jgi:KDO2-lipid IV(A) lauroyltransferase